MSKTNSSPFASFADAAENDSFITEKYACSSQLTLRQLLNTLQNIADKNPDALDMKIFHVEDSGLVKTKVIEVEKRGIVLCNY
jgi:hypothetical protein